MQKKSSNLWLQLYCTRRHRCALASHAYADIAYKYAAIEYNYLYKYTAGHFNAQSPTSMRTCMNCTCCSLTFVFLADQERVPACAGDSTQVLRQHIKLCPTAPGHCRRRDKAHLSVPLANLLERVSCLLSRLVIAYISISSNLSLAQLIRPQGKCSFLLDHKSSLG